MRDISDLYVKASSGEGLSAEETLRMFAAIAERDAIIQSSGKIELVSNESLLQRAESAEAKCQLLQARLDQVHARAAILLPKIEAVAVKAESSAVKKICGHFRDFCEAVKDV